MSDITPRFEIEPDDDGFMVVLVEGDERLSTGWWSTNAEAEALVTMLNEMLERQQAQILADELNLQSVMKLTGQLKGELVQAEARCKELEQELYAERSMHSDTGAMLERERTARDAAQAALERYGAHGSFCPCARFSPMGTCTCGLSAALAQTAGKREPSTAHLSQAEIDELNDCE